MDYWMHGILRNFVRTVGNFWKLFTQTSLDFLLQFEEYMTALLQKDLHFNLKGNI
jgi:hypothetical protein